MGKKNQINYSSSAISHPPFADPDHTVKTRAGEVLDWKTFGHVKIKHILRRQLEAGKFPHAYLFFGPDGLGKKYLALEFAGRILETNKLTAHPDFQELNVEGEILMEMVLDFISKLHCKPFVAKKRVAIINNAQNLNLQSSNALLKTLEEPAESIIIILIANRQPLPTIVSRCQVLNFNLLSSDEIKMLAEILNLNVDRQVLDLCFGSSGRLVKLNQDPELLKHEQEMISEYQQLQNSRLAERLLAIVKFALIEVMELEKVFSIWLSWQLVQLRSNPSAFKQVQAIGEAISGLRMNKNKKLVLQGLFLKI